MLWCYLYPCVDAISHVEHRFWSDFFLLKPHKHAYKKRWFKKILNDFYILFFGISMSFDARLYKKAELLSSDIFPSESLLFNFVIIF